MNSVQYLLTEHDRTGRGILPVDREQYHGRLLFGGRFIGRQGSEQTMAIADGDQRK
jgi:hypothetical protein